MVDVRRISVFLLLAAATTILLRLDWTWRVAREPYCCLLASCVGLLARPCFDQVLVFDNVVRAGTAEFSIVRGCDALEPVGLLAGAVLAFPTPLRRRCTAVLIGAAMISLFNLSRILALIILRSTLPDVFEVVHVYVFQISLVLFTAIIFTAWTALETRHPSAGT